MKCEKSGNHTISYQSLLLSTTVLNDVHTGFSSSQYSNGSERIGDFGLLRKTTKDEGQNYSYMMQVRKITVASQ